jgi:heme exporter protein D
MQAANHMGFIVAAYAVTIAVVGVLIGWVMLDYRAQRRALDDLEKRGVSRRSEAARAAPTMKQA